MRRLGLSLCLVLFVSSVCFARIQGVEGLPVFNSSTTGEDNSPVVVTLAAVPGQRAHVYGVDAWCSAGTSTITITDGGVTIWKTQVDEVTSEPFRVYFVPAALTGQANSAVVITLTACGSGNTGTLIVQADRF